MTKKGNLHIFPSLVCVVAPLTFMVTLALATKLGHVAFLPYISDTGNHMPESCIFSQFLNFTAICMLACVYIRYLQVKSMATFKTPVGPRWDANDISWYMGFTACLGMDIVANFQVHNIYQVHYVGALLCFVGGSVYFAFQTMFSYHMSKVDDSMYLFYIRCILCALAFIFCCLAIASGVISDFGYTGTDSSKWKKDDGGYSWHLVSTTSEWLLAIIQSALTVSFFPEFRRISIYSPKFEIRGVNDSQSENPSPKEEA
ncbi:hypothetical protein GE061_019807 [Apolygus lucorum]|uniref:CWH43-like N-terminal domain-containing protein n=1 Tax=Apolygus lucorum TaxID=248454 RepID=A0A6A4JV78_APOLU|nr:hypothetical protein GE061_019807 [Apolygus lucorum]